MPRYGSYPSGAPAALADKILALRGGSTDVTLTPQDILTALSLFATVTPAAGTDLAVVLRGGVPKLETISDILALATAGSTGRNFLINGGFDVQSRATSYAATTTAAYGLDRWYMKQATAAAATFSVGAPATAVPGFKNALKVLLTGANTNIVTWGQIIESVAAYKLQGQTVDVSARFLKGSSWNPANLRMRVFTGTGADQGLASLIAGTWTTQAATLDTNLSPATSWGQLSATVAIPTGTTEIAVQFDATPTGAAVDANSFLLMTGADIRPGTAAPVAYDSIDVELEILRARRFFRKINSDPANNIFITAGQANSTTTAIFPIPETFGMRKAPALSFSAVADLLGFFGGSSFPSTVASIGGSADLSAITQTIGSASYTVNGAPLLYLAAGSGKFIGLDSELT